MADAPDSTRNGANALITAAAVIVVIWGLRWSADFLLPVLSAAFISVLCIPPIRRLERHGAPTWLALSAVLVGANLALILVAAFIGRSVLQFEARLDHYRTRLDELLGSSIDWLNSMGADLSRADIVDRFDSALIIELVSNTASSLMSAAGDGLLIGLTVVFVLLEASGFPAKLRVAFGNGSASDELSSFRKAAEAVHQYLAVKTLISVLNGLAAALVTWAIGVDFPLLWGLLAFLFNYIPNIGAVLAAIPPVILALLDLGPVHAAGVIGAYLALELILGNVVEPKLLGSRLGLSTLVVWLSLVFWNWVWGPVGMLLSVPLTVIVKILLENHDDTKAIATLLGPSPD